MENSVNNLWFTVDKARYFLIPDTFVAARKGVELLDTGGKSLIISAEEMAQFEVTKDIATDFLANKRRLMDDMLGFLSGSNDTNTGKPLNTNGVGIDEAIKGMAGVIEQIKQITDKEGANTDVNLVISKLRELDAGTLANKALLSNEVFAFMKQYSQSEDGKKAMLELAKTLKTTAGEIEKSPYAMVQNAFNEISNLSNKERISEQEKREMKARIKRSIDESLNKALDHLKMKPGDNA